MTTIINPYEVLTLFPIPLYKTNIEREFTKQEQDEFDAIISKDLMDDSRYRNWKGISTDKYLLNGTRKPLLAIRSFIVQHLKKFSTTILGINENEASCNIPNSWLNVYEPNAFNPVHHHVNSIISGIFYINCLELPDNKTDGICFHSQQCQHLFQDIGLPITHPTEFSSEEHRISVVTGDLVLFPSSLKHSVNLNETTNQTRISLSFNTFTFGKLYQVGDDTTELILRQGK